MGASEAPWWLSHPSEKYATLKLDKENPGLRMKRMKICWKIPLHVMNDEYITIIYRQKRGGSDGENLVMNDEFLLEQLSNSLHF